MLRFITPDKGRMRNVLVKHRTWQWIGTVGLIWLQQHKEQLSRGNKRARELPAHAALQDQETPDHGSQIIPREAAAGWSHPSNSHMEPLPDPICSSYKQKGTPKVGVK